MKICVMRKKKKKSYINIPRTYTPNINSEVNDKKLIFDSFNTISLYDFLI